MKSISVLNDLDLEPVAAGLSKGGGGQQQQQQQPSCQPPACPPPAPACPTC